MKLISYATGRCFIFVFLFYVPALCQDYQHGTYSVVQYIPIRPLSEQGEVYFKQDACASAYGLGNHGSDGQQSGVDFSVRNGQLSSSGSMGNYAATVSTDFLSVFNFIPACAEFVCRLVDINGRYYKNDTQESIEDILYGIDKDRHKIYSGSSVSAYDKYFADAQYLKKKIYELEIQMVACGTKKSALRTASLEVRDKLILSLQYIESQCDFVPEQKYKIQSAALNHALEKVRTTKFKHKKDKQCLFYEYQRALAQENERYRAYELQQAAESIREKELQRHKCIQWEFTQSLVTLEKQESERESLRAFYAEYCPIIIPYLDKRVEMLHEVKRGDVRYSIETYAITGEMQILLQDNGARHDTFTRCHGNQYQQSVHQESVSVLEKTTNITVGSVLYAHRGALATFAEVACDYNHVGESYKAIPILDVCWSLLSWGTVIAQGVAEGALLGVASTVTDIIEHPVQAAVSVLVGSRVMLTYQLGKVLYTVADLGVTTLVDPIAGKEKWDSYIKPLSTILDAMRNKEIGLREGTRTAAQFGVQCYTQAKLLNGLHNLYDGIKTKALSFLRSNTSAIPQQYLATPDGHLFKAATAALHLSVQEAGLPLSYCMTPDGRLVYASVFSMNNVVQNLCAQSIYLIKKIPVLLDSDFFEQGSTGILALINAQAKASPGRESMAEMVARLVREKSEACPSPQGPKKDDDDQSPLNGVYKGVAYHHENSEGCKNPAPKNGQKALDNSKALKTTSHRRVGISEGEIVILDQTKPGEFHGHIRTWYELTSASDKDSQKMVAFLLKNKWVNSKGQILV